MYGLPADAPIGGLVGRTLVQIGVGRHELVLRLDGAEIMVAGDLEVDGTTYASSTEAAPALFGLLGVEVTAAERVAPGTLRLVFGGAGAVSLLDSWPAYESYVVTVDGIVIVV